MKVLDGCSTVFLEFRIFPRISLTRTLMNADDVVGGLFLITICFWV